MPIHGELLMTSPFRGISETDSEFQFLPAFFHTENLSSTKRFPHDPCIVDFSGSSPLAFFPAIRTPRFPAGLLWFKVFKNNFVNYLKI